MNLFLFEGVDEFDGREETAALAMMFDSLDSDRYSQVRLARAGDADQDRVMSVVQELAMMRLAEERLIDIAAGEVEAGEVAIVRKSSGLELIRR